VTPFVSLEATRELAVRAAHARIVQIAACITADPAVAEEPQARRGDLAAELRVLMAIINDAEELELRKFVIGRRAGEAPRPDPDKAQAIAIGQEPAR
jgi:hypothetical protein